MARSSLSGLGTTARRAALVIRLIVIAMLAGAVARPQWRKESEHVSVIVIMDQSESVPAEIRAEAERYVEEASRFAPRGDLLGRVTVARDAYVQALPGNPGDRPDSQNIGATDGTNLAEGVSLGMAVARENTANRMALFTDANETSGSILAAAQAAIAAHIPIDVMPFKYKYSHEVMVDRLVAPATARMGESVNLRMVISATKPCTGRVDITVNGQPIDLDPDSPDVGMRVTLKEGVNPLIAPITLTTHGPQNFEAIFTPDDPASDTIKDNNRQRAVTFVSSEGKVLVIAREEKEALSLMSVLQEARLAADLKPPTEAFTSLIELSQYDAVVMVNTPNYDFNQAQQEELRSYVHDVGGGLVMIGGSEAFGAGGWIGSPTADALPIKLDPPQKRQMPRGALVLIMHSCEMPQGNYWGKETCLAAVDSLSRLDLVGVIEYNWQQRESWVYPLSEVGNKGAVKRAINGLTFGDAPSYAAFMQLAITDLEKVAAGQKHCVIISDGDCQAPNAALIQRFVDAKVTVSTIAVWPHGGGRGGTGTLEDIAKSTNGNFYLIQNQNQFATLPRIFVKEAQVVKRSLIWEGTPFTPAVAGGTEAMRGIGGVPQVAGYVVTAEREGLAQVVMRGQENDPLLAQWQYGLGKSVAFMSDAGAKWGPDWVGWAKYRAFWEQHIRWAMRPSGSAELRVSTEDQGDKTRVVVEALDSKGERLSFLRWRGAAVGPDGKSQPVNLRQFGPGQYEAVIDSARSGSYMLNFKYDAPGEDGQSKQGSVQAAVTRPFADEYRALQDNAPLLIQVAKLTGGRVLDTDPRKADLWSRANLAMPVATKPIWLAVAIAAIGLFLLDVAVRRVRIDVFAMAGALRRGMARRTAAAGQQMGSLREARERAKQAMATRSKGDFGAAAGNVAEAPRPAVGQADKAVRSVKFEASETELAAAKRGGGPTVVVDLNAGPDAAAKKAEKPKVEGPSAEEGMSRLLKAKKRAQEEMGGE
jgi:uncharacterized membrane protein